jgi:predicted  nucleic acid-binding Zn-ribbon protein
MPANNEQMSEMESFSRKIDRLNDTIILNIRVDHLDENRRELQADLKDLYKEKNNLIEKMGGAKLDVLREKNAPEKAILQKLVDFYKEQLEELDKNYKMKTKELEEVKEKKKIIENKIYTIEEKTPQRSGNSTKTASRGPPPSSVLVASGGTNNLETPTISSTQLEVYIEDCNKKRQRLEEKSNEVTESVDLLAQQSESDDDDEDDELFKKIF